MRFFDHLEQTATARNSLLCVGLDPRPERFPADIAAQSDPIFAFNKQIIDATRDLVCAYKPNAAFYEAHGLDGLAALRRTIDYIGTDTPVILDAKRGDIGSTAAAYARAAYEVWGAGAVTVHPYLGSDSVSPFTSFSERAIFVLCHTSNPGASELQTLLCEGETLYLRVARLTQEWDSAGQIGLVIGATYPSALRAARRVAAQAWFLVPGVGAQGGDLDAATQAGLRADGLGMVISASRSVCHAPDPRAATVDLRDRINAARGRARAGIVPVTAALSDLHRELILDLARIGAVRFGQFTLKSGKTSPIYIDLRLLASHPQVLHRAASAYVALLKADQIPYDRIAAIPYAAMPIGTAVSLHTDRPMIYPRKEVKSYGTRRAIEGLFEPGERAVVLDDLITTGGAKIEAIAPLEQAGLEVEDIVVLIDRQSGGAEELARHGYRLHAVLTLRQILGLLADQNEISAERRTEVLAWLDDRDESP